MTGATAGRLVGSRPVRRAAGLLAGGAGRGIVLVYHRVLAQPPEGEMVVPWVTADLLRRQIEAIRDIGPIVPVGDVLAGGSHRRPRFALTFDDDSPTHLEQALPLLEAEDAPATFFLSGRSLHGLGGYWWDALEREVATSGVAEVARRLDVRAVSIGDLALAAERDPGLRARMATMGAPDDVLTPAAIARLGEHMTIGFHTVHHPVLTTLADAEVERAVVDGRDELATAVGQPIDLFAYPHGKADPRAAGLVARAGYSAALTGAPGRVGHRQDRHRLPRFEPARREPADLVPRLVARLVEPAWRTAALRA